MRIAGFSIGAATSFWDWPTISGEGSRNARLHVGEHCVFNARCHFGLEDRVTIGNRVSVGHEVRFLTSTLEACAAGQLPAPSRRAPIVVEDGAWLGARCVLMPGVRVGAGAVIGAAVTVHEDVAPDTMLVGARSISLATDSVPNANRSPAALAPSGLPLTAPTRRRRSAHDLLVALRQEVSQLHAGLALLAIRNWLLPAEGGDARRAQLLRATGFVLGDGCAVHGLPQITGSSAAPGDVAGSHGLYDNLLTGRECTLHQMLVLDLEGRITLGDGVTIGAHTMILTSSHELGPSAHRAGPVTRAPVTIGAGARIGVRCLILPGVTIGEGAVVADGSLVNKDVAPLTHSTGASSGAHTTVNSLA